MPISLKFYEENVDIIALSSVSEVLCISTIHRFEIKKLCSSNDFCMKKATSIQVLVMMKIFSDPSGTTSKVFSFPKVWRVWIQEEGELSHRHQTS